MCPEERSRRKFLYQKALFLLNFTGHWVKIFRAFGEVVSGKVVIIPFYSCRGEFRGRFISKKVFLIVSRLGAKNLPLKGHQDDCENFILRVRWNFLRKNILFMVIWYIFSCIWAKNSSFLKKFPQNWKNSILHVYRNVLMKLFCFTKDLFSLMFSGFEWKRFR